MIYSSDLKNTGLDIENIDITEITEFIIIVERCKIFTGPIPKKCEDKNIYNPLVDFKLESPKSNYKVTSLVQYNGVATYFRLYGKFNKKENVCHSQGTIYRNSGKGDFRLLNRNLKRGEMMVFQHSYDEKSWGIYQQTDSNREGFRKFERAK